MNLNFIHLLGLAPITSYTPDTVPSFYDTVSLVHMVLLTSKSDFYLAPLLISVLYESKVLSKLGLLRVFRFFQDCEMFFCVFVTLKNLKTGYLEKKHFCGCVCVAPLLNVAPCFVSPCESGFYQLTRACYLFGLATLMKTVSLIAV